MRVWPDANLTTGTASSRTLQAGPVIEVAHCQASCRRSGCRFCMFTYLPSTSRPGRRAFDVVPWQDASLPQDTVLVHLTVLLAATSPTNAWPINRSSVAAAARVSRHVSHIWRPASAAAAVDRRGKRRFLGHQTLQLTGETQDFSGFPKRLHNAHLSPKR